MNWDGSQAKRQRRAQLDRIIAAYLIGLGLGVACGQFPPAIMLVLIAVAVIVAYVLASQWIIGP